MEIPLAMEVIAPSTTSTSTIGLLWTTGSTWLCNVPITSATATNYNTIRLGYNQRYQSFQSCTVEYVRFSNGLTTTYPSPGGFMWAYEFNGTYANTGSESYSTTFAQGTSSLVTDGSVRGLSVPSATGANTILATIVGLNTRGASDNDGFGNWTVEVRMKFNASGASTQANVFMMGQDNTGTGAGARIDSNANMVELLTVGNPSAAGSYVSVWVWRSGRILMFTGNAYTETAAAVVDTSEFVLGVHLTPTAPVLYINGATPAMTANGWRTMDNAAVATNTLVQMSAVAAERGVYLGYRRAWTSGAVINASFKNWRFVDTLAAGGGARDVRGSDRQHADVPVRKRVRLAAARVTYGFRIDDDETLQFVKTQGSATTSTLLGKPLPASDDASGTSLTGNVLGTLTDTSLDVVLSLANKVDTSTTTSVSRLAATSATPGTQPFVAPTDEWVLWDTTLFQNVYFVWYTGLVEDGIRGVVLSDYPNKNKLYFNSVNVPRRTASALGTREVVHLVDLNFAVRSGQFPSTPALMGLQNVGWPNIVSSVVDEFAKTRGYGSMFEPQNLPCRVVTSAQWPSFSASTNWKSVGRYDYFTVTP
eukprot:jgi/Mesvir1/11015/Mv21524-RA.1